jgi:hypothetical protein
VDETKAETGALERPKSIRTENDWIHYWLSTWADQFDSI